MGDREVMGKKKFLPMLGESVQSEAVAGESVTVNANAFLRQQVNEIRDQIAQIREELRGNLIQPLIQRRLQRIQSLLSAFTLQTPQKKAEKEAETIKCPSCGAEVRKEANYCPNCGEPLKTEEKWRYRGKLQLRG